MTRVSAVVLFLGLCLAVAPRALALDPADLNQDGVVDAKDMGIVMGAWKNHLLGLPWDSRADMPPVDTFLTREDVGAFLDVFLAGLAAQDTQQTYEAQTALMGTVIGQFAGDWDASGPTAARNLLVGRLMADPHVRSARLLDDGITVEVQFSTGTYGYVVTDSPAVTTSAAHSPTQAPTQVYPASWQTQPKALILEPYKYLYAPGVPDMYPAVLAARFQAPVCKANQYYHYGGVTLDDFKDWSEYRLVIVVTHGTPYMLDTGVPADTLSGYNQSAGRFSTDTYTHLWVTSLSMMNPYRPSVGLTQVYFRNVWCPAQSDSLIIFAACYTGTGAWADALASAGASAYAGNTDSALPSAACGRANTLLTGLAAGQTVGQASPSYMHAGPTSGLDWHIGHFIGGDWDFEETGTATLWVDGQSETDSIEGSGTFAVEQDGTRIRWTPPGYDPTYGRTGTIQKHAINATGPAAYGVDPTVVFTQNTFSVTWQLSADHNTITGTGAGSATGTFRDGTGTHRFTLETTCTDTLTRSSPVPVWGGTGLAVTARPTATKTHVAPRGWPVASVGALGFPLPAR